MKLLKGTFDFVTLLDKDGRHGVEFRATKKDGQDVVIKTVIDGCLRTPKTKSMKMPVKFVAKKSKKAAEVWFIDHRDPMVPLVTFSIYKTCNEFHSFMMEYTTEKFHSLTVIKNLPIAIKMLEHHLEDYGYRSEGGFILTKLRHFC